MLSVLLDPILQQVHCAHSCYCCHRAHARVIDSKVLVALHAGTLIKLTADQLAFAPTFISAILGLIMAFEGQAHALPDKLRQVRAIACFCGSLYDTASHQKCAPSTG